MQLLDANWLRAASRSLRDRRPGLYASLNRVRNRLVSRGSGLAAYQATALRRFAALLGPPAGKRVLEVGSDLDGNVLGRLAALGVAEVVGVNPDAAEDVDVATVAVRPGNASLRRADARALPFDDASFDAVFSVATFEHILELPRALAEMHRVLRPGGFVFSKYGPIWSGCRGHHLRVQVGDREFRHFRAETNPLPDFVHLLLDREELAAALAAELEPRYVEAIVAWVFDDPGINRLFHHEYLRAFAESPFTLRSLRPELDPVDEQLDRVLRWRHPREREFAVTNCEAVLAR